jgi:hypothetical protein
MSTKPSTKRQIDPLVYSTSRWQEMLFQKRQSGNLQSVLGSTAQALRLTGQDAQKATSLGLEVFSRLYDDPEKLETPDASAPWAETVHSLLGEMPEFQHLSSLTGSDPDMAALATADLLRALEPKLPELVKEDPKAEPPPTVDAFGRPTFQLSASDKVRAVLRGACRDASQAVQDAKTLLNGIAPGLGEAPATHEQEDPRRAILAQALTSSAHLRKIVELAGRLERIAQKAKKRRCRDSYEEVVDIERGGDLGRILPSELAGLRSVRAIRLLTLQKVADRTALQYRLEGHEPMGRGEMVVALDESGSMSCEQNGIIPNTWTRAIGLACLRVALEDRRPVTVLGFNGGITSIHRMEADGSCYRVVGGQKVPMAGGFPALALEVISRGCGGGTSFDAPIRFAVAAVRGSTRPDLLFVTDGMAHVSQDVLEELADAKKTRELRVYGVAMGHGSITGALASVCDHAIDFRPEVERLAKIIPG